MSIYLLQVLLDGLIWLLQSRTCISFVSSMSFLCVANFSGFETILQLAPLQMADAGWRTPDNPGSLIFGLQGRVKLDLQAVASVGPSSVHGGATRQSLDHWRLCR